MSARPKPIPTVLVVDDEPVNIQLLERKLSKEGIKVLTASNGPDCISITQSELPDLILLDVMMPEMDGLEVCQILQENGLTKAIPIIFVTAYNSRDNKLEGLGAGAVDYITKPIDLEETAARVRTQLNFLATNKENIDLTQRLGESRRAAAIGALTQGIAHNLNNLLSVVMGYVQLAKVNYENPEKLLDNINRIEGASNRIVGIIKQLSTVAFSAKLSLHKMAIDRLIEGALYRAEEDCGRVIQAQIENELGNQIVHTNIEAFEEALAKLVINAWESYDELAVDERPILLSARRSDDGAFAVFELSDKGRGIDPEIQEHMFEPFVSTKHTVGVGMGLSIARHAIRALGGDIAIESSKEGGVTVRFTHPLPTESVESS